MWISGVLGNLTVPPLVGKYFIDRFVKDIFGMKRRIVPKRSFPVSIFSEYTPMLDPLAVLQSNLDAETNTDSL